MQESTKEILFKISDILGRNILNVANDEKKISRTKNTYFKDKDLHELERLKVQQQLLKDFDRDAYNRLLEDKRDLVVLDLGSNDGSLVMDRLGCRDEVKKIIAIEIDPETVKRSNEKYQEDKIEFFCLDLESKDFMESLNQIMLDQGIEAFDFVNISMILLHIENPERLLWKLRKVLKPKASVFIRDIDDGFNVAYPDPQNIFQKTMDICARRKESGYRKSGREIYSILHNAQYTNIRLEKQGINTIGMSADEREAFFNTYFSFIIEDAKNRVMENPNDLAIKKEYDWLSDNSDELEESFYQKNFFFNLGFMIFTAQK